MCLQDKQVASNSEHYREYSGISAHTADGQKANITNSLANFLQISQHAHGAWYTDVLSLTKITTDFFPEVSKVGFHRGAKVH